MRFTAVLTAFAFVCLVGVVCVAGEDGRVELSVKRSADVLSVYAGEQVCTSYKFDSDLKKPYFWPVSGPVSGKSVTVESTEPYPHHNSLFFGCDRVNGGNYWQEGIERGQIVSQGPRIVSASAKQVVFVDSCLWQRPGAEPPLRDYRLVTITVPGERLRFIDFDITLEALVDVHIEQTNHSLFSARVRPELSVDSGGVLINAAGATGEKGTWGVESPWCDYYGTRDGVTEGIAILQHPENRWYPAKWFTRNYGFFSPTPMQWPGESDGFDWPKGEEFTLRYRVVVHAGDVKESQIDKIFEQYKASQAGPPAKKVWEETVGSKVVK